MNREEYMNKAGDLEYEMNIINDLEYGNFNMGREPGTSTTINTPIFLFIAVNVKNKFSNDYRWTNEQGLSGLPLLHWRYV